VGFIFFSSGQTDDYADMDIVNCEMISGDKNRVCSQISLKAEASIFMGMDLNRKPRPEDHVTQTDWRRQL